MSSLRKAYETLKKEHERLKLEANRSLSGTISAWERKLLEANNKNVQLEGELKVTREKLLASREDGALLFAERAELLDTIGNLTRIIGRFYRGQSLKVQT